jgi:hypothetical protein
VFSPWLSMHTCVVPPGATPRVSQWATGCADPPVGSGARGPSTRPPGIEEAHLFLSSPVIGLVTELDLSVSDGAYAILLQP